MVSSRVRIFLPSASILACSYRTSPRLRRDRRRLLHRPLPTAGMRPFVRHWRALAQRRTLPPSSTLRHDDIGASPAPPGPRAVFFRSQPDPRPPLSVAVAASSKYRCRLRARGVRSPGALSQQPGDANPTRENCRTCRVPSVWSFDSAHPLSAAQAYPFAPPEARGGFRGDSGRLPEPQFCVRSTSPKHSASGRQRRSGRLFRDARLCL